MIACDYIQLTLEPSWAEVSFTLLHLRYVFFVGRPTNGRCISVYMYLNDTVTARVYIYIYIFLIFFLKKTNHKASSTASYLALLTTIGIRTILNFQTEK